MRKVKINHILIYKAMYDRYDYSPHSSSKMAKDLGLTPKALADFLHNIDAENNRPLPRLTILANVVSFLGLRLDEIVMVTDEEEV